MSIQIYKRKNKAIRKIFMISLIILISIIWILPNIIIKNFYEKNNKNLAKYEEVISVKKNSNRMLGYDIIDLVDIAKIQNNNYIQLNDDNIIYTNKENVQINIPEKSISENYRVEVYLNDEKQIEEQITEQSKNIEVKIDKEQQNKIKVSILKGEEIIEEKEKEIYYIKPYENQFLDSYEYKEKGLATHIRNRDDENRIDMIKSLGANTIREEVMITDLFSKSNLNYNSYTFIDKIRDANINYLGLMNIYNHSTLFGSDAKISDEQEVLEFVKDICEVAKRFPQIKSFEILNESNGYYNKSENFYWYSRIIEELGKQFEGSGKKIITGATMTPITLQEGQVDPIEFFNGVFNNKLAYKYSNAISYHIYDLNNKLVNNKFKEAQNKYVNMIKDNGGFTNVGITEFGSSTATVRNDESQQARIIVQQSVLQDNKNYKIEIIYNWKDKGENKDEIEDNYGIVRYDYTPKPSYYAIKNYYENTNGAEYIGTVNIADGLEFHVYDKDGVPKIIAWSNNVDKDVTIPYKDFKAKDLYGKDIQADEMSNLTITTEPVYLDNINRKYFYQAISNTMTEKYAEFETKFGEQISQVSGLQQKLVQMKQKAQEIGTYTERNEINENTAIQYMKDFYTIGNTIINEYKKGQLNIEDVKLSSMLDSLNDIGDSYEDLVTITAQTRNSNFEETNKIVKEAEDVINNGKDLNNIYPSKILDFAKEFNEKATYINNLEEENDIKTGLIVSKNLHANLLADWAKQFADVYIDKYLQENPVQEITYTTEDGQEYQIENITNKSVIATLPTTDDMQITSEGGNTHTFEHNDSFTFKYTRRGRDFEVVINIENIDKDAPIITGVENNKLYTSQVSVNVEDKNLKDVKVICNDEEIKYDLNTPLQEEGIYEINATDKAENSTKIVFQLIENASEIYIIGDKHISNIQGGTTSKELRENLLSSIGYDIKRNDKILADNEIIRTGDTIETKDMHQIYTLIVAGDVNKDGEINIRDLVRLRKYLLGQIELDELEKMSSDANVDNKEISIKDFVRIRILILSK